MRPERRWERAALAAGALAATALSVEAERRHLRRVAHDPENAFLRRPPHGSDLSVRAFDGTELHAEVFGPEDGQTIVLAHGWTENLTYWAYITRHLVEQGFRVVAYDHRGHGRSAAAAEGDYSIPALGRDLDAVLEAAVPDGQRATVAGHSLGGMAIVSWAEGHEVERRVHAAALLNTGMGDLLAEQLLLPLPALAAALNRVLPPSAVVSSRAPVPRFSTPLSHLILRYVVFGRAASPAQVAFYERMLVASPPDARASIGMTISELDLRDALPRLTVPTLILAGEQDRLTPPAMAHSMAKSLPDLRELVVLSDTGHMAPLERPDEVARALLRLADLAKDASSRPVAEAPA